ncbi:MAG: SDR family oxidoreductase [Clostridia bacterium]|nr:SDR family oxidoreductase [Clostridia bacterium]
MSKTVLVTGASGGIGGACARLFAAEGYKVAVHYNSDKASADKLADEIRALGGEAVCVCADLSDEAQVADMLGIVERELGEVDVLVNNAGVSQQKLFTDTTREDYDLVFGVNILGVINCCRAVLPAMIRRKSGSIVNVSSMWGVSGASCEVLYSASKAAVIGLTKALAKEVGPSSVRVNCIAPGVIATKMNSHLSDEDMAVLCDETPLCRTGEPQEVAQAVLFLASDKSAFITGQTLSVDGGFIT